MGQRDLQPELPTLVRSPETAVEPFKGCFDDRFFSALLGAF